MPVTITATAGSATANSFASEAETLALALETPGVTGWVTALTDIEKQWLIDAQRVLSVLPWAAHRTDNVQALPWPRSYVENPDAPGLMGIANYADLYFADTVVPKRVKDAQILLAIQAKAAGVDLSAADANAGVIEKTVDPLTTRWTPYARAIGLARFPRVLALIAPLLESASGSLNVVRV